MRVLMVAATEGELAGVVTDSTRHQVVTLVTGVGMVATAAHVARALARETVDLALNVGVCGAFDRTLPLGAVVHVVGDQCSELGVEDGATFVSAGEMGLVAAEEPPYTGGRLVNDTPPTCAALDALPKVTGITVNTVHGHEPSIAAVVARCHPQVESMEGAAFMYACLVAGVRFAQVRAISNYVERRNRAAWDIPRAVTALGRTTTDILEQL